jgi:hypothetical protein
MAEQAVPPRHRGTEAQAGTSATEGVAEPLDRTIARDEVGVSGFAQVMVL